MCLASKGRATQDYRRDTEASISECFQKDLALTRRVLTATASCKKTWRETPRKENINSVSMYLNDSFDIRMNFERNLKTGLVRVAQPNVRPSSVKAHSSDSVLLPGSVQRQVVNLSSVASSMSKEIIDLFIKRAPFGFHVQYIDKHMSNPSGCQADGKNLWGNPTGCEGCQTDGEKPCETQLNS